MGGVTIGIASRKGLIPVDQVPYRPRACTTPFLGASPSPNRIRKTELAEIQAVGKHVRKVLSLPVSGNSTKIGENRRTGRTLSEVLIDTCQVPISWVFSGTTYDRDASMNSAIVVELVSSSSTRIRRLAVFGFFSAALSELATTFCFAACEPCRWPACTGMQSV